jgi:hypothetical protein
MLAAVAAVVVSLAFAGSANAASIGSTPVDLTLNTYDASNDGFVGPLSTTSTLTNNDYYAVTAGGTWSNWGATLWDYGKVCGTPTLAPMTVSPNQVNYKAGIDPVFVYAFARGKRYDCSTLTTPKAHGKFQFSVNGSTGTYRSFTAAGNPTTPSANHTYSYYLQSATNTRGLSVRFEDPHSSDNYGEVDLTARRARDSDCTGGNWANFRESDNSQAFNSQNSCQLTLPSS